MKSRGWGRSLGLIAAWVKIPVLIVLGLLTIRYSVPLLAEAFTLDMGKMLSQAVGKSEPPASLKGDWVTYKAAISWSFASLIALFTGFGLFFPVFLIVLLNRPSVRAELATKTSV